MGDDVPTPSCIVGRNRAPRLRDDGGLDVDALGTFERKPGVWDPIVGLAWHTQRRHYEVHALFEGGGFGAG